MPTPLHTYRVQVLGCRVNHAERRELEGVLRGRGLREARPDEPADLEIIHTCSVTGRAAAKSRQAIRRATRNQGNSGAVLVTGCLVGTDPDQALELTGPTGPGGGSISHQTLVPQAVGDWLDTHAMQPAAHSERPPMRPSTTNTLPIAAFPDQAARHVRAEVRIQDGCDAHCTFCIIPAARPVLRTKQPRVVLEEVSRLIDLGHPEIVLAGIFLGAYGHETAIRRHQSQPDATPLADLVDAVASLPGLQRLRLSSLEPGDVTDPLLDAFAAHQQVIAPHLHLPLQSGSDEILRRMNRQYDTSHFLDMIDRVSAHLTREGVPPAITTDIICGFPGETEDDFEKTVAIARQVGFLHMHVFPFSARSGTAAARWHQHAIEPRVMQTRVRAMIDLETTPKTGLADTFRNRLIGREVRLFAEQPDRHRTGHWTGRCDHYCEVSIPGSRSRGELVRAIVRRIEDDVLRADPVPAAVRLPVLQPL
jgi:threonylcarbamoyladenosine tRNA methylthiotransferase MtaB